MYWKEKNSKPTNFKTTKFSKGNFISFQNSSFLEHLQRAATETATVADMNAIGITHGTRKN